MNIKENIYYIVRNYVKKYLTGNLGEVVEDEDKLVCYVRFNKSKKINGTETFLCYGMKERDKVLAESYKLNKPIYYVFSDLEEFLNPINIFGYNCNVYINDCEFYRGLHVRVVGGKCTIEATDINALHNLMLSAHELVLQDLYLNNEYWYSTDLNLHISANDILKIDGCTIGAKNRRLNINLASGNELIINGSKITGDVVNCKAKSICYSGNTVIDRNIEEKPMTRVLEK